ncbi:MAG: bifunctional nuclease family protein [Chloroflexi bacterium]|nr:bifunctional nuclease family protein [Chloroflexota bacterium]
MSTMVEVVIDSIRVGLMSQQRIVVLRESDADRYLAIWIDPYMAEQITFALQEVEVQRPMTHDLLRNLVRSLDARIVRVEVIELRGEVYYGNIVVEVNGHTLDIDSRPSDALALAVRTNVPILVSQEVMEAAGIVPEEDIGDEVPLDSEILESEESEEGENRLSVFEDFIEQIDPDKPDDDEEEKGKKKKK